MSFRARLALVCALSASAPLASSKSARSAPYRAWTSWDLSAITGAEARGYGREFLTEANVVQQSDALAASPLADAWGPEPVTLAIDSFWAADPTKVVDAFGRWTWNTTRFPNAERAVGERVRANGQHLGLYLNPGVPVAAVEQRTPVLGHPECTAADIAFLPLSPANTFWDCRRINFSHPCAQPFVDSQALLLAQWGCDFLKIDAVSPGSDVVPSAGIDNRPDIAAWTRALERSGRDIWLTISWRIDPAYAADFAPLANAWRTSDDVDCYCDTLSAWHAVRNRFFEAVPWLAWLPRAVGGNGSGGGFPDLDSLNVAQGELDGLSADEKQTSVTLWALVGSPLYTGNDLNAADAAGLALLGHADVLAINALAAPPALTAASANGTADLQVWYAAGAAHSTVVAALFNLGAAAAHVTAVFAEIGAPASASVRDVWSGVALGRFEGAFSAFLPPHGSRLLRIEI